MYKESNTIKIILLGEAGCGKTNLINACCNFKFNPNSVSNLTASFSEKKVEINKIQYNLRFWDTAGQEKYRSLNTLFIKDSQICILVYDITNRTTFEELDFWKKTVKDLLDDKPLIVVVGNKIDLYEQEEITEEEGEEYAKKNEMEFILSSAKKDPHQFEKNVIELVKKYLEKNKFNQWEFISNEKDEKISINKTMNAKNKKNSYLCLI